uniref:Late embryogenesis abundant n=1 Tax=Cleistogenes songorica TaxID=121774 RepID=A0A2S1WLT8_9POAL|nr:late embryogenesis abundant [Cleistogenes songorica]
MSSQPQQRRGEAEQMQPQPQQGQQGTAPAAAQQGPIKYGDAFNVKGELAGQPIAPQDAAAMRSAEQSIPGVQVPQEKGGGFSAGGFMESAAQYNQAVGAVQPGQASEAAAKQGINITQDPVPGGRIVTEFVASQVVGQYAVAEAPADKAAAAAAGEVGGAGASGAGATAARRNN